MARCRRYARLLQGGTVASPPALGVAFNPYLTGKERHLERDRLRAKLETGAVSSVWLQFGAITDALQDGLSFLSHGLPTRLRPQRIVGSLFLPTRQLIAQQKFRPWNGVILSDRYLTGPDEGAPVSP